MPTFAANLTMLFQEEPFLQRFKAARDSGFSYVEYLFPYEYSCEELKHALDNNGLQQVLFNLPPGDWSKGERGIACLPDRTIEFREGVRQAINYANYLNVPRLNCLAGLRSEAFSETEMWETLVGNLKYAASELEKSNIELVFEAINSRVDMPGFFIDTLSRSRKLLDDVDHNNLGMQFDIYHMQIMHGDIIRNLEQNLDVIKHIQFADNPGRHEPGSGELNFEKIFAWLDKSSYDGYVSAEYVPESDTDRSLAWLQTFN
jgi:hydroxypyruvate isomerase